MIELSVQAPVPQSQAGAVGMQGVATGASGFLHLFEILLGGMPQGGVNGEGGPFAEDAADGATTAGLPLGLVPIISAPGVAPEGVEGGDPLAALLEPSATGLPMADAVAIADLMRTIGFPVSPAEIASLGPLDLEQLSSAMEFLQRGVQAGMAGDDLLESVSCLLPREWPFHGGEEVAIPRSEGLSSGEESPSGIDAARILACAEVVRGIIAFQQPSAAPASAEPAPAAVGEASILSTPVATDSDIRAIPREPASAVAEVAERPSAAVDAAGSEDAPGFRPGRTDAPRTDIEGGTRIGGDAKRRGFEIGANTGANVPVETPSVQAWGSKPVQEIRETASPIATQGVKAGSMASEFIGRQVLEKVDVQLRQGRRELNVRLWPEELGEVRLSLRIGEADKLDARIMVQTESVRQAILDATPQLRDALARHGMEMGRLSVNIDSGMASGEGTSQREGRKDPEGGNLRWGGRWQDEEVEYGAALALGVDSGYRDGRNTLDMWS